MNTLTAHIWHFQLELNTVVLMCAIWAIHYVGDFILQSHAMASQKSKSWKWLSYHVLMYTALWGVLTLNFKFTLINGVIHFLVDAVTSRMTARLFAKKDWHNFFVVVGLDQLLHFITLAITAYMFL